MNQKITLNQEEIIKHNLSKNLKYLRNQKNISQQQLSRILNISRTSISNYETKKYLISVDIATTIASYFKITLMELLYNSIEERKKKE